MSTHVIRLQCDLLFLSSILPGFLQSTFACFEVGVFLGIQMTGTCIVDELHKKWPETINRNNICKP